MRHIVLIVLASSAASAWLGCRNDTAINPAPFDSGARAILPDASAAASDAGPSDAGADAADAEPGDAASDQ